MTWVQGDFFGSYGITLIAGRTFSADEQRENRNVAIVNKRPADAYWTARTGGQASQVGVTAASPAPWLTVIGVAGDVSMARPEATRPSTPTSLTA